MARLDLIIVFCRTIYLYIICITLFFFCVSKRLLQRRRVPGELYTNTEGFFQKPRTRVSPPAAHGTAATQIIKFPSVYFVPTALGCREGCLLGKGKRMSLYYSVDMRTTKCVMHLHEPLIFAGIRMAEKPNYYCCPRTYVRNERLHFWLSVFEMPLVLMLQASFGRSENWSRG